ncbi:MAG: aminopeptidase [Treponema sp.]|jgi:predicted aminopeptidase|nr:aminopeptidase [Treponema sp.]
MKIHVFFVWSVLPALAAVALLFVALLCFSGCYTLKQGFILLGYLSKAVPLEKLTADPEERRFAERVEDIRRFSKEELGLKQNKNYTTYVSIDRNYLAAVASAAQPDAFVPYEWRFPLVGAVPYKGFFNPEDARAEAEKLKKKGLDVWIRGVDAFSTLGWFKDPLYSYMKNYPPYQLADLLIHEQLHATVYLAGQSQFNEELAEFVGGEGARLYMEKTFGAASPEYRAMLDDKADNTTFVVFIRDLTAELDALYQGSLPREEKLREKERIIARAQERFASEYEQRFRGENHRFFSSMTINNAYLELYRLYYSGEDYLASLYERSGKDLRRIITAAASIKRVGKNGDPRIALEAALFGSETDAIVK